MPINKKELTKEQIEKAMQCKTADELMRLRNYQRRSRGLHGGVG